MPGAVEYLVVDTSAFIKNAQLQHFGQNLITIQDVVDEIKNKRQLRRLVVLPYELDVKEPDPDNIQIVTSFSKKTGDYPALSATDLKVLALTYQLEKQHVGTEHLREEPTCKNVEPLDHSVFEKVAGFYLPEGEIEDKENDSDDQEVPEVDELLVKISEMTCNECDQNDPCALDDDEAGWITPGNIDSARKDTFGSVEEKSVKVACLTTDFAMQNVLKQMGLNMISLDGQCIKEVRTFILRCYACFKTTSIMTKIFCPNCGNKTLKRVSVTVDSEGKEHIHINFKKALTARGKKFPVPRFKGGKHSNNPILSEDQRVPQQRVSKLAMQKTNALDPDYIAGASPFIMRDVCSKSAVLGVHHNTEIKTWMRKNPNEVVKRRRKK